MTESLYNSFAAPHVAQKRIGGKSSGIRPISQKKAIVKEPKKKSRAQQLKEKGQQNIKDYKYHKNGITKGDVRKAIEIVKTERNVTFNVSEDAFPVIIQCCRINMDQMVHATSDLMDHSGRQIMRARDVIRALKMRALNRIFRPV